MLAHRRQRCSGALSCRTLPSRTPSSGSSTPTPSRSENKGEIVNTGTVDDDSAEILSQDYPFFYFGYKKKGSSPTPDDDNSAEILSQDYPFFYFGYKKKGSSPTPADDNMADESLSQDYPFFYFGYKHSSPTTPADGGQVAASKNEAATRTVVFFHEDAVRVGETLPIYFPPAMRSPRGVLPRNVADSIPFASSALPDILARFGIAAGSAEAAKTERTLGMCEAPSLQGEAKFCATSLEAMVEGALAALGTRDIRPVTSALPRSGAPLQRYTIRTVRRVEGSSFVACHDARHPFTVFMCHDTGKVRAYMADMEGARGGGSKVTVAVVCHTDTSKWDPEHMSLKLLGTEPGGSPVCHFMPYGHIMWAKNAASSSA